METREQKISRYLKGELDTNDILEKRVVDLEGKNSILTDKNTQKDETIKNLSTLILDSIILIEDTLLTRGVSIDINTRNVENIKLFLERLMTMTIINPRQEYTHYKTDEREIIYDISKITPFDGIIHSSEPIPDDVLKGYSRIVKTKIVVDKDLKQDYIDTFRGGN